MNSAYQVDESVVLISDDYMKVALKRNGLNLNKIMDILMEVDRLYEEKKPSSIIRTCDIIKKNLYKVDKKIVNLSSDYLFVALINKGINHEKAFKILNTLDYIYRGFGVENMKTLAGRVEPNEEEEFIKAVMKYDKENNKTDKIEGFEGYRFLKE